MDDLTSKLMELLADKENLENIKSLSSLISANLDSSAENSQKNQQEVAKEEPENEAVPTDVIQTVMRLMPVISSMNKEDENTKLLSALRPHLSARRQEKLDESIKMMQMFKVLPMLKSQGIF